MKKYVYPAIVLVLFSVVFWALPSYLSSSEALQKANLQIRDIFFKIRQISSELPSQTQEIVMVMIDEESCAKLESRWPWPRGHFAKMIRELDKRGARAIGLNVSFTGYEDGDDVSSRDLADAMAQHGNVVIGVTFDNQDRLIEPNAVIEKAVSKYGYLEKIIDLDFVIRRSYLLRTYQTGKNISYPGAIFFESSFPLQLAAAHSGPQEAKKPSFNKDLGLVTVGTPNIGVYVSSDGSYVINYLASELNFKRIPAWKVIEGKLLPDEVKEKTVLVGLTSSLFSDKHPTPLGIMSGIGIHANELVAMISRRMLRFVPDGVSFFISWLIALCVLALFLVKRFWLGLVGFIVAFGGIFLGTQLAFSKDVVLEPFIFFLGPTTALIAGVLANSLNLLLENKGLETKIVRDKMTGLYTYEYLRVRLDDEWLRSKKLGTPVSVVMTDLDRFKKINDTLGHEVGNDMIRRAADVIRNSVRGYDVVSRYGGDEFVILLWHATVKDANEYKARLRDLYHTMAKKLEPALQDSSISIGTATFDPNVDPKIPSNPQALIEEADKALFKDKESRR